MRAISDIITSFVSSILEKLHLKEPEDAFLPVEKPKWTKWHSACMLIATLLGGTDLVVADASKIIIKMKRVRGMSPEDGHFGVRLLAAESNTNSAVVSRFPAVFGINDVGKDLSWWSEIQAMTIAKIVWLNNCDDNTEYGCGNHIYNNYRTRIEVNPKLPHLCSEEELMIRASIAFGELEDDESEVK